MNGRHDSGDTWPPTHQGSVNSASMKTPPERSTILRTSESASIAGFAAAKAEQSSHSAARSFGRRVPAPRTSAPTNRRLASLERRAMTYQYSFKDCLERAERITWRVEDLIND